MRILVPMTSANSATSQDTILRGRGAERRCGGRSAPSSMGATSVSAISPIRVQPPAHSTRSRSFRGPVVVPSTGRRPPIAERVRSGGGHNVVAPTRCAAGWSRSLNGCQEREPAIHPGARAPRRLNWDRSRAVAGLWSSLTRPASNGNNRIVHCPPSISIGLAGFRARNVAGLVSSR